VLQKKIDLEERKRGLANLLKSGLGGCRSLEVTSDHPSRDLNKAAGSPGRLKGWNALSYRSNSKIRFLASSEVSDFCDQRGCVGVEGLELLAASIGQAEKGGQGASDGSS